MRMPTTHPWKKYLSLEGGGVKERVTMNRERGRSSDGICI